jgi:septal ring factor EnvC (AmiA/AmiB activator)
MPRSGTSDMDGRGNDNHRELEHLTNERFKTVAEISTLKQEIEDLTKSLKASQQHIC